MPALLLRFAIVLENFSMPPCDPLSGERRHGPLFHRWLPDGEKDAIELSVDDAELRVWFEQNGYVENGRVKFDYERKELDAGIVSQEPVLDAGPLIGTLKLPHVPEETLQAVQENRAGDPAYVAFGRRVAMMIHRPVARLLNVMRTNYGQYWISELKEWDQHGESLGSYFSLAVQTKWSLDDGATWADFLPDAPERYVTIEESPEAYGHLMTPQDWRDLQKAISEGYEPRLGAEMLSRIHELIEREDYREAALSAATALEVALNEFVHRKTRMNRTLAENLHPFHALPVPARLTALATLSGALPSQQVESALKLVEMSQKIVRDGWNPPATAAGELRNALQTIAALLSGPNFKFPSYHIQSPVREAPATEEPPAAAEPA